MGRRSDFGKKSKEVCTKPSRKSAGTGKRGCTKLSRNSSKAGESAARNRVGIRRGKGKAGARNQVGTRRKDGGDAARNRVGIRRKRGRGAARNHVGIRRFAGGVLPVTASAFAIGQRGVRLSPQRRKRRCRKRKKYPTQVGYFYMKTDFDVVCFQKVSRPKPF